MCLCAFVCLRVLERLFLYVCVLFVVVLLVFPPCFLVFFVRFIFGGGFVVVFFWHDGGRSTSFFRSLERYINCPYSGFVRIAVLSVFRFCPFSEQATQSRTHRH